MTKTMPSIGLYGVRTNNLKNFDCHIPIRQMTVLTGVSGSGKSSLAFDTLYAEGQRRFLESMSAYVRMFLNEMPKPPVDRVDRCLPAIALRQQSSFDHPRSTVATVTETLLHIAQLFANMGEQRCIFCGGPVAGDTPGEIARRLQSFGARLKIAIYVTLTLRPGETAAQRLSALVSGGYRRLWRDGHIVELENADADALLGAESFDVLIDRVVYAPAPNGETPALGGRLSEAFEEAFGLGDGAAKADILGIPEGQNTTLSFNQNLTCRNCGAAHAALRPECFDPNATLGACPDCTGFGLVSGIDWQRVLNPNLSLENDAVIPFRTPRTADRKLKLLSFCKRSKIPTDVPLNALSPEQLHAVKFGKGQYKGVNNYFDFLQSHANKFTARIQLARFRGYYPCQTCGGTGMGKVAQNVLIGEKTIGSILPMTVADALAFFNGLDDGFAAANGSLAPLEEVRLRLSALSGVGLGYLTLSRKSKTLSGGEAQRLYLSCGLGRGLSDTLYVLDEPTAGLHPKDTQKLIGVMKSLQAMGNTLVVVEHDAEVIRSADRIIELGPCGGEKGGCIVYEGDVAGLARSDTPTGRMMRDAKRTELKDAPVAPDAPRIRIEHARMHNLNDVSVDIPCHCFVACAGVSGSGKSTLIRDILCNAWIMRSHQNDADGIGALDAPADEPDIPDASPDAEISGFGMFDDVIMMEQNVSGRSSRACVATMTRAFAAIRALFADQPLAKQRRYTPGSFSFNSDLGRCERCEGLGTCAIEMMFLNDIVIPCPQCGGKRYIPEILEIECDGKNIADILEMTVTEAAEFFKSRHAIHKPLAALCDIGLGYIRLGQSTSSLSGGEFQRLKLATYLDADVKNLSRSLFIFDEPTVGLHMQDIACLLAALGKLTDRGASVIVIEHNLDLIARADHIIELGPGGGPGGGRIIFEGTPAGLSRANTPTGNALREFF